MRPSASTMIDRGMRRPAAVHRSANLPPLGLTSGKSLSRRSLSIRTTRSWACKHRSARVERCRRLTWQRVAFGFATEQHCHNAQEREAGHERCPPVEAAAKGADEEPGNKRTKARDDAGTASAKPDRSGTNMGRKQLR